MTKLEKCLTDSLARQARDLPALTAALTALVNNRGATETLGYRPITPETPDDAPVLLAVTVGEVRAARAAIEQAACDPAADWEAYMELCRMGVARGDA